MGNRQDEITLRIARKASKNRRRDKDTLSLVLMILANQVSKPSVSDQLLRLIKKIQKS